MKFFSFMHINVVSDLSCMLSPLKTNYEMIDKSYYAMKKKIAIKRSKREK